MNGDADKPGIEFIEEPDLPLSTVQTGILAEQWIAPTTTRYNVPIAFAIKGELDEEALRSALNWLIQRHEILRTVYRDGDMGPIQAVAAHVPDILRTLFIDTGAGTDDGTEFRDLAVREAEHVFDLRTELPVRVCLARSTERQAALILVFHHIAVDGWSIRLLLDELGDAYNAFRDKAVPILPEVELQYADWGAWQQDQIATAQARGNLEGLVDRIKDLPFDLGLPARHALDAHSDSNNGAEMVQFDLDTAMVARAEAVALREGVSLYAMLAGTYALVIGRLVDRDRLAIGTPVALRDRAELHQTVGCFVNTAILELRLDASRGRHAYLTHVRDAVVDTLDTRDIPFEQVMRARAKLSLDNVEVVRSFFNFDDAGIAPPKLSGMALTPINCDRGTAKFDLMMSMVRTDDGIQAGFDYAIGVLAPEIAHSIPARFVAALEWLCRAETAPMGTFALVGGEESRALCALGQGSCIDVPNETLDARILQTAAEFPNNAAVNAPDGKLDFAELSKGAQALARLLAEKGVGHGDRVLVILPRGVALPLAMLGVLNAAAAYVPLDINLPEQRLRDIVADARPAAIIFAEDSREMVERVASDQIALVQASGAEFCHLRGGSAARPIVPPRSGDLAYMIYTSGSTGRPKAVMVPHGGVMNYLLWAIEAYGVGEGDGTAILTATAFDATVLSFWAPLIAGKPVHLMPEVGGIEALADRLAEGADYGFVKLTPAHLGLLAELHPIAKQSTGSRKFVVGGEALTKSTTTPWRKAAPSVAIFNEYGPTETVVGCTAFKLGNSAPDGRSEPIGKAIWNTQLYVLDRKLAPIPAGMVGELYIGGAGVSWGYWRQAGLTADRFIADPFTDHPGSRMYRTGDLVRLGADGNLEYLGRNDNQLKVSGYRIEPGEIEARLQAVDGVSGAAVVAMSGGGDQRLVAFYTGAATVEACNAALTSRLPPYMVPDRFVLRDSLPLTANDKVDRGALASLDIAAIIMDGRPGVALDQSIARESGEEELADPEKLEALITIWRNVLQEEDAGADTDFFAAGGTSLGAIRLIARLKRHFGQTIEYADLALSPTPQGLALTMFPAQPAAPADLPLVLDLYRTILDTPEMDGDTDFFEAGGTSLNAIRLVARLRRGLGQEVPADIVHGGRTARGVAALIAQGNCAAGTAPGSTVDLGPQLQLQTDEAPQASPGEQQLWLENELGGQATAYVMQAAIKLKLPNAEEALGAAFGMLAERHPVLRTAYTSGDTGSEVEILSAGVPTITNRTVGRYETLDDLVRATAQGDAALSFRIDRGKTSRLSFVETADGDGVLILSLHHIVSDNTSLGLILGDLIALLTSGTLGDAPKANYRAYAQWRERRMQATADGQIAYWQRRLAVPPSPLAVPLDRPRTRDHSPVGGSVPFRIDKTLTNAAASLARRNGGSIQNVLVAAYTIFLHRLTGAGDLIFGIPVSDRPEGFDDVAGYFLNTLPLRVKIAGGETGEMLLQQIRDTMAELLSHADQPLARIVEATNPERFEGRTPLLQTVLDWREGNPQLDDLVADEQPQPEAYPLDVATAPFDLALSLSGQEDGTITGGFIFDYASLDSETVAAWTRSFVMILEGLVQQSDCPIRRLPTVAAQDLDRASLAGPKVDAPPELSLLLLRALAEYDSLPAVESGDVTLTYGDLRARAQDIIPGPGKVSIIDTDDPVERVVQALAAILGQKVLALFDPALPQARRDKMRSTLLAIETEGIDGTVASYVQFTSGTTGEPKAALLSRVGLANLIRTLGNDLSIKPGSRVLQLAAPAFDAWVWEVFITLGAGGTLVLADRSALHAGEPLAVCLRERAVSHVTITPSALAALGQVDLPELTTIVAAGEPLSADLMETWAPGRRMFNAYGPCEATVCASHGVCAAGSDTPDIGTPIVGMTAMVMDRYAMPAIPGAVGELWVGGIGVGLGYVGAPAITAERFIADPGADDGRRLYCTGDMARIRTNVRIQFIGRDDRQVKVRGVRMELDEIEAALQAVAGVRQAAAKTVPDATGRPALAAWVTGPAHDEAASIREALAIHLPETMLPAFLTVLDHMPVTATGKIDRLALSDPRKAAAHPDQAIAAGEPSAGAEPCSELEAVILDVFADILALPARPGRDQNFFVLGGHSLLVVRLAAALSGKLDRKVPLPAVFANPTAAGLAGLFTSGETQNACVIRTLRHGTGPAAFLFHAVDGSGHCYDQLAGNWHGDRHINVVEQGQGFDSLETLAEGYAQAIDTAAGDGDTVLLGGWSLGATIAAAVAEQLRRQGRDVRVVLIDAARPVPHENEHSADETEIAAAAKAAGADGATVDRVRENIRIAANHSFGRIPGPAAVIRASDTPREGAAPDLGWAGVFDSTAVKTMPGSHHTILRSGDLPALSRQIERLWDEQEA